MSLFANALADARLYAGKYLLDYSDHNSLPLQIVYVI